MNQDVITKFVDIIKQNPVIFTTIIIVIGIVIVIANIIKIFLISSLILLAIFALIYVNSGPKSSITEKPSSNPLNSVNSLLEKSKIALKDISSGQQNLRDYALDYISKRQNFETQLNDALNNVLSLHSIIQGYNDSAKNSYDLSQNSLAKANDALAISNNYMSIVNNITMEIQNIITQTQITTLGPSGDVTQAITDMNHQKDIATNAYSQVELALSNAQSSKTLTNIYKSNSFQELANANKIRVDIENLITNLLNDIKTSPEYENLDIKISNAQTILNMLQEIYDNLDDNIENQTIKTTINLSILELSKSINLGRDVLDNIINVFQVGTSTSYSVNFEIIKKIRNKIGDMYSIIGNPDGTPENSIEYYILNISISQETIISNIEQIQIIYNQLQNLIKAINDSISSMINNININITDIISILTEIQNSFINAGFITTTPPAPIISVTPPASTGGNSQSLPIVGIWKFPEGSNTHGFPDPMEIKKTTTEACTFLIEQIGGDMTLCMQGVMICLDGFCLPLSYVPEENIYKLTFQSDDPPELKSWFSLEYNANNTATMIMTNYGIQEPYLLTRL